MQRGSLTIVGTGIQLGGHLTLAAQSWIKQADKVLFAVADPVTAKCLQTLNPTAEALPEQTECLQLKSYTAYERPCQLTLIKIKLSFCS